MNRQPQASASQQQRAREQQAVLNQLRAGQSITGAKPANPFIGGIQTLFGGAGAGTIPSLNAARLGGQEVLMNRGGWDRRVAGSGPINVGGQTWYPAQSGQDLVYKRAPGNVGGQYGSILSKDQLNAPPAPNLPPAPGGAPTTSPGTTAPAVLDPYAVQNREYERERSRVEAMVKANPDMQKQAIADERAKVRDQGMAIWAQKYGKTLAPKVQPGQVGYDVIQKTLYPGGTPAPKLAPESEAMLDAIAPANEFGVRPDVTPMPGQLPAFGSATESMFNAVTSGGSLVTPMPQIAPTPQTQAQDLAEAYRQAMLARILTNK